MGLNTIHIPGHPGTSVEHADCADSSITLLDDFFLDGVMWGWTGPRDDNGHVMFNVEQVNSLADLFYHRTDRGRMQRQVIKELEHFLKVTVVAHPHLVVTLS